MYVSSALLRYSLCSVFLNCRSEMSDTIAEKKQRFVKSTGDGEITPFFQLDFKLVTLYHSILVIHAINDILCEIEQREEVFIQRLNSPLSKAN